MRESRILVTGATGFVGRHLVRRLLERNWPLTLTLRQAAACPPEWRAHPKISLVTTGPLETAEGLADVTSNVSTVVHLAGLAHVRSREGADSLFMRANAEATAKLAESAAANGVSLFVHASSLAAITDNAARQTVDDATAARPPSAYGRSKRAAEEALAAVAAGRMLAISLRPPLICGPEAPGNWGMLQRLAATGIPLPFGSVGNRRSLLGIATLTDAILHLCSTRWPMEASGDYCIADKGAISLRDIVVELRAGMGMGPRLFPFPPAALRLAAGAAGQGRMAAGLFGDLVVDATRFFRTFGLEQSTSVAEAVRQSARVYPRNSPQDESRRN